MKAPRITEAQLHPKRNYLLLGEALDQRKPVTIRYEVRSGEAGPIPGDVLVTRRHSCYLVTKSRLIRRRTPGPLRFELKCVRCALTDQHGDAWSLIWDKRIKRSR